MDSGFEPASQQSRRWRTKERGVHRLEWFGDSRAKRHACQNVPFQIDAGGEFNQFEPLIPEGEDAALRHVEDRATFSPGPFARKGHLADGLDELLILAFLFDFEFAVFYPDFEAA